MIVHPYQPGEFQSTDLQPQAKKDAYLETSHYEVLLMEPQRQLKLRSRHIAATAGRLVKEKTREKSILPETDVVKVIELVITSLSKGLNTPSPFSRDSLVLLSSMIGSSQVKNKQWYQIIEQTICAAEAEVSFRHYLLYEYQAGLLLKYLSRITPAHLIEEAVDELSEEISTSFLRFCSDAETSRAQEKDNLKPLVANFLRNFAQLLKFGNEMEVLINICRFWAEQMSARYTCSLQEWQFFIGSIEQSILKKIGLESGEYLAGYFHVLNQAIPRLTFTGEYYRQKDVVVQRLEKMGIQRDFDWHAQLNITFGEVLLSATDRDEPSPSRTLLLRGISPLDGATASQFQLFSTQALNACRPLAERNWLDWLEYELTAVQNILQFRDDYAKVASLLQKSIEIAASNLRQGLNAFKAHTVLNADLSLLLEEASRAILLSSDIGKAKQIFRAWFVFTYAAEDGDNIWNHGNVIVNALLTSLRKNTELESYWVKYSLTLDLVEGVPDILKEVRQGFVQWPHLSSIVETSFQGESKTNKESITLLRRALSDYLRCGRSYTARESLVWMGQSFLTHSQEQSLAVVVQNVHVLSETLNSFDEFAGTPFAGVFNEIAEGTLPTVLNRRLWLSSDAIGAETSEQVYALIPDYKEQTGEAGIAKCARDNAITLRRIALSFSPTVLDRIEFVETWWNNLINNYIVTRPQRLFIINREQIVAVCDQHFGSEAASLINRILEPVYGSIIKNNDEQILQMTSIPPLGQKELFEDWVQLDPDIELKRFYSSALVEAFKMATGISKSLATPEFKVRNVAQPNSDLGKEVFLESNLDYIGLILINDFAYFEWTGVVGASAISNWKDLLHRVETYSPTLQRFLFGIISQADLLETTIERLRAVDFIQAHIDQIRQITAGLELKRSASALAEIMANRIDASQNNLLNQEPYKPNIAKCHRDLTYVMENLAEALISHGKAGALLHIHRYISWQISPYISYGEEIWKIVWDLAEETTTEKLSATSSRELGKWWRELRFIGKHLPLVGIIHKKFASSPEPVFSLDPDEEFAWRTTLSSILSILLMRQSAPELAENARILLLANNPLSTSSDFTKRLDQLMKLIRNWFIDLDLKIIQVEIESLKDTLTRIQLIKEFARELPQTVPRIIERIPALANLAEELTLIMLRMARATSNLQSTQGIGWNISPLLKGMSKESLGEFNKLTEMDKDRFRSVLINVYASAGGSEDISNQWLKFHRMLENQEDLATLWQGLPTFSSSVTQDSNRRTLLLALSRRILSCAWTDEPALEPTLRWCRDNILAELGEAANNDWKSTANNYPGYFHSETELSKNTKQKFEQFLATA